jgi:hypothetical protein
VSTKNCVRATGRAYLIDKGGYNLELRKFGCKVLDALRTGNEVKEQDMILRNTAGFEDIDGHDGGTT